MKHKSMNRKRKMNNFISKKYGTEVNCTVFLFILIIYLILLAVVSYYIFNSSVKCTLTYTTVIELAPGGNIFKNEVNNHEGFQNQ